MLELTSVTTKQLEELKQMGTKILFGFNLANDFTHVAKIMNENSIQADMLLRPISEGGSSELSHPKWEDPSYPWKTITWNLPKTPLEKFMNMLNVFYGYFFNVPNFSFPAKISKEYDIVISTPPTLYFHKHENLIVYDAGQARTLPVSPNLRSRLIGKNYRMAKKVVYTNPDMFPLFNRIGIDPDKLLFIPFAIDYNRYSVKNYERGDKFKIFMYSRLDFIIKGSDHILYALKEVIKEYPNVELTVTKWGAWKEQFHALVIALKLEAYVKFVDIVPKAQLIERIQQSDVIADQFIIGSYGTASPEALSCGKPVLIYIKEEDYQRDFGAVPPIANCNKIVEIKDEIIKLIDDKKYRDRLGVQSRQWIIDKHNPLDVFSKKIDLIHQELLGGK